MQKENRDVGKADNLEPLFIITKKNIWGLEKNFIVLNSPDSLYLGYLSGTTWMALLAGSTGAIDTTISEFKKQHITDQLKVDTFLANTSNFLGKNSRNFKISKQNIVAIEIKGPFYTHNASVKFIEKENTHKFIVIKPGAVFVIKEALTALFPNITEVKLKENVLKKRIALLKKQELPYLLCI